MKNASIVGAIAILLVLVIAPLLRTNQSRGYFVLTQYRVPALGIARPRPCNDLSRPILLRIDKAGRWFINYERITSKDLPRLLDDIFEVRAEKVALVLADSNVDVQAVTDLLDAATRSKAGIEFLLLSDPGDIKQCLEAAIPLPSSGLSLGAY